MTLIKPAHAGITDTIVSANPAKNIPTSTNIAGLLTGIGGGTKIIDLIFFAVGMVFFFNILYAAYEYIVANGVPQNIQAASKRLTNSLIGIAIVMTSFIIIRIVGSIIGVSDIV